MITAKSRLPCFALLLTCGGSFCQANDCYSICETCTCANIDFRKNFTPQISCCASISCFSPSYICILFWLFKFKSTKCEFVGSLLKSWRVFKISTSLCFFRYFIAFCYHLTSSASSLAIRWLNRRFSSRNLSHNLVMF